MPPSDFSSDLGRHGDRSALLFADRPPIAYAELEIRVAALAARLEGHRLIAIEAATEPEPIVAWLAALRAGVAAALLPCEPATRAAFAERFRPDATLHRADGWRLRETRPGPAVHPDLALILLTSGSGGQAKAVRLSRGAVFANASAIAAALELGAGDRAALTLPLAYSYGLSVLNSHFAVGGGVFAAGSILAPGFLDDLRAWRCANLAGVPLSFDLLESIGFRGAALPDLRLMTAAGGRLAPDMVRRYAAHMAARGGRFHVMYGQTEATARMAILPAGLAERFPDRVGRAIPGGALSLVAPDGAPITAPETEGELIYRGPNVMMGYARDHADLARGPEVAALRTGDLAVCDTRGLYRITGRLRRMSKIAGRRLGHDALEAAMADRGLAVAIVGDDSALLAIHGLDQSGAEVRARLAKAAGLTLSHVRTLALPSPPRLGNGKLDYEALRAHLPARRAPEAPPRSGIAEAFRETFHPRVPGPADSFASLGGDSLRHVELSLAIERRLGHLPDRWETTPLAELARLAPAAPRNPRGIGADLVIRALAILAVVVQHATLWPVPVGSAAMIVLIGFGIGRFQRVMLASGEIARFLRPVATVLAPYYLLVGAYALVWGTLPWASVLLVGNFGFADPPRHDMLPFLYWFVEVYVQIMLLTAALFLAPPLRAAATRAPFRLGLGFLAVTVALHFALPELWPIGPRKIFSLPWVLYLAAFGWCAATAERAGQRWLLLGLALLVMPAVAYDDGNWIGSWMRYGAQVLVIACLLFAPRLPVPGWLAVALLPVAAASYHIYLLHRFAPELLLAPLESRLPAWVFTLLAIGGGVALGLVAHRVSRRLRRWLASPSPRPLPAE